MSTAPMHADPPSPIPRQLRRRGDPRAVEQPATAAKPRPLVDPARAGHISASGATRASVHRRRALIVTAVRPNART